MPKPFIGRFTMPGQPHAWTMHLSWTCTSLIEANYRIEPDYAVSVGGFSKGG